VNKATLIHFTGYISAAIGAIVGIAYLSHIVPPEQYGIFALYIAIGSLAQHIARETTGNALLRYSEAITHDKTLIWQIIKSNRVGLISVLGIIGVTAFIWFSGHSLLEKCLSVVMCMSLMLAILGESLLSSLLNRTACAIYININQWLRFIIAGLCYQYIDNSVSALILGFIITFALSLTYALIIYRQSKSANTPQPAFENSIFAGASPYLIGLLSWNFLFLDRIIIEKLLGEGLLGVYFILIQIGFMPVVTLLRALSNYLFPLFFQSRAQKFRPLLIITLAAVTMGFAFLLLFHQWLFSWLVGQNYQSYSWLLPWMYGAAVIHTAAYLFQASFFKKGGLRYLLAAQLFTAVLGIALIITLSHTYQLAGTVLAKIAISLLLISFSFIANKTFLKKSAGT
jgi:O-antigen/teichoic acid export membrane protein